MNGVVNLVSGCKGIFWSWLNCNRTHFIMGFLMLCKDRYSVLTSDSLDVLLHFQTMQKILIKLYTFEVAQTKYRRNKGEILVHRLKLQTFFKIPTKVHWVFEFIFPSNTTRSAKDLRRKHISALQLRPQSKIPNFPLYLTFQSSVFVNLLF